LECEHRPLKVGEKPKRKGETTIYEATGGLNPQFIELWQSPIQRQVTIKHDGTSMKIAKDDSERLRIYKRYDVRKKTPPLGSLPGGYNDDGSIEFVWIDITDSTDPSDKYMTSAFRKTPTGQISGIYGITLTGNTPQYIIWSNDTITPGTYELIGSKIQNGRYLLPTETSEVQVCEKGQLENKVVERHYFIRHGSFIIDEIFSQEVKELSLVGFREFILKYKLEGIVIHFENNKLFKVNRGHIGVGLG